MCNDVNNSMNHFPKTVNNINNKSLLGLSLKAFFSEGGILLGTPPIPFSEGGIVLGTPPIPFNEGEFC